MCAEEAARVEPRSVEAHHDRAAALQELGRLDEAESAFTRALALDPDDPETLAGAADLYVNRLPPTNDHTETGLEFARRGSRRLKRARAPHGAHPDRALVARLALLEGQALNDLGRSREALMRLDAALAAVPDDSARALRARRGAVRSVPLRRGQARLHRRARARTRTTPGRTITSGLTLERLGDVAGGRSRAGARAHRGAGRVPLARRGLGQPSSARSSTTRRKKLPPELRADLGRVSLETSDLPDLSDLTAEEPPLAPTILGLFRGAPLGEAPESEARAIVIYRKNLARAVASRDELMQQIRTTLLHELGHLRGEDDDALRARGLE